MIVAQLWVSTIAWTIYPFPHSCLKLCSAGEGKVRNRVNFDLSHEKQKQSVMSPSLARKKLTQTQAKSQPAAAEWASLRYCPTLPYNSSSLLSSSSSSPSPYKLVLYLLHFILLYLRWVVGMDESRFPSGQKHSWDSTVDCALEICQKLI